MMFKINNEEWQIIEVEEDELKQLYKNSNDDGYMFGLCTFSEHTIRINKELSLNRKKKTLYHELMHCYIFSFITTQDIEFNEELVCDISSNSHDIIHDIVVEYFRNKVITCG